MSLVDYPLVRSWRLNKEASIWHANDTDTSACFWSVSRPLGGGKREGFVFPLFFSLDVFW